MPELVPYLPGWTPVNTGPLARFLPPLPEGVVVSWLNRTSSPSPAQDALTCVLDPFGASPWPAVEAARAGYRVLVAANNPVARFLLEMAANPPAEADFRATLAELAAARKGEERLEPHIRSLYHTNCDQCGQTIMADAFVWERDESGEVRLSARIYHCPHCGRSGEFPAEDTDRAHAAQFSASGLHRARALERVAPVNDPDRHHVEEALAAYLPRAVYALFTLINKLDGLSVAPMKRRALEALLLNACDRANTLWPHPVARARPRQLTIPPRFLENNVWLALEQAIDQWAPPLDSSPVPLTLWPEQPPQGGGICLFEGRLRDLGEQIQAMVPPKFHIGAVLAALPRPNQAFWTLSALWSGWLWGREAVGPFKSVLRRRRYDWAWHSTALQAAFENLYTLLKPGTPVLGMVGEVEPGFLSAALIAAEIARFDLEGIALRPESGQAQINWQRATENARQANFPVQSIQDIASQAAREYLMARGEPAVYLQLHTAALSSSVQNHVWANPVYAESTSSAPAPEILGQINAVLEDAFSYRAGFLRYGGSEKSLEVGHWWLRENTLQQGHVETPLADRVEMELVRYLQKKPGATLLEIDTALCRIFPGLMTPASELVHVCLESYGEQEPPDSGHWRLRTGDTPKMRRADLDAIRSLLQQVGQRLGYQSQGQEPLVWLDPSGNLKYTFHVIASAVFGEIVFTEEHPFQNTLIVLPGGRANLAAYKLQRDPRLRQAIGEGWRFVKFRQVRWMAKSPLLSPEMFEDQLTLDLLTYNTPQLRLL